LSDLIILKEQTLGTASSLFGFKLGFSRIFDSLYGAF